MARPRTPIGTFGTITIRITASGVVARCRFRDQDGRLRQVTATAPSATAAERALKTRLTVRDDRAVGMGPVTADSPFPKLVELWLEDLDLEGRIAPTTRQLYEWNMRHLVLPTFEHLTLREITVSRVDRFLKTQAKVSYNPHRSGTEPGALHTCAVGGFARPGRGHLPGRRRRGRR